MGRGLFSSLRARMALLLSVAVLVTVASTVLLVFALGAANTQLDRLVSAQNRLELLSAISGRMGDYALTSLQTAQQPGERTREALVSARARRLRRSTASRKRSATTFSGFRTRSSAR